MQKLTPKQQLVVQYQQLFGPFEKKRKKGLTSIISDYQTRHYHFYNEGRILGYYPNPITKQQDVPKNLIYLTEVSEVKEGIVPKKPHYFQINLQNGKEIKLRMKKEGPRTQFINAVKFFSETYKNDKSQMIQQARKYKETIPYIIRVSIVAENEQRFFYKHLKAKLDEDQSILELKLSQGKSLQKSQLESLQQFGMACKAKIVIKDFESKKANIIEKSMITIFNQLKLAKEIIHWDVVFMFLSSQKVLDKKMFQNNFGYLDDEIRQEEDLLPLRFECNYLYLFSYQNKKDASLYVKAINILDIKDFKIQESSIIQRGNYQLIIKTSEQIMIVALDFAEQLEAWIFALEKAKQTANEIKRYQVQVNSAKFQKISTFSGLNELNQVQKNKFKETIKGLEQMNRQAASQENLPFNMNWVNQIFFKQQTLHLKQLIQECFDQDILVDKKQKSKNKLKIEELSIQQLIDLIDKSALIIGQRVNSLKAIRPFYFESYLFFIQTYHDNFIQKVLSKVLQTFSKRQEEEGISAMDWMAMLGVLSSRYLETLKIFQFYDLRLDDIYKQMIPFAVKEAYKSSLDLFLSSVDKQLDNVYQEKQGEKSRYLTYGPTDLVKFASQIFMLYEFYPKKSFLYPILGLIYKLIKAYQEEYKFFLRRNISSMSVVQLVAFNNSNMLYIQKIKDFNKQIAEKVGEQLETIKKRILEGQIIKRFSEIHQETQTFLVDLINEHVDLIFDQFCSQKLFNKEIQFHYQSPQYKKDQMNIFHSALYEQFKELLQELPTVQSKKLKYQIFMRLNQNYFVRILTNFYIDRLKTRKNDYYLDYITSNYDLLMADYLKNFTYSDEAEMGKLKLNYLFQLQTETNQDLLEISLALLIDNLKKNNNIFLNKLPKIYINNAQNLRNVLIKQIDIIRLQQINLNKTKKNKSDFNFKLLADVLSEQKMNELQEMIKESAIDSKESVKKSYERSLKKLNNLFSFVIKLRVYLKRLRARIEEKKTQENLIALERLQLIKKKERQNKKIEKLHEDIVSAKLCHSGGFYGKISNLDPLDSNLIKLSQAIEKNNLKFKQCQARFTDESSRTQLQDFSRTYLEIVKDFSNQNQVLQTVKGLKGMVVKDKIKLIRLPDILASREIEVQAPPQLSFSTHFRYLLLELDPQQSSDNVILKLEAGSFNKWKQSFELLVKECQRSREVIQIAEFKIRGDGGELLKTFGLPAFNSDEYEEIFKDVDFQRKTLMTQRASGFNLGNVVSQIKGVEQASPDDDDEDLLADIDGANERSVSVLSDSSSNDDDDED